MLFRIKTFSFFFLSNPLDVSQLTSIAETCGEKPVAVRPRHQKYSDTRGVL